jgi:hypothetical protein
MPAMQVKSPKKSVQKTWSSRFATKRYPKRVTLDAPFAGLPAGSTLFVGTPQILQTYIRKIPSGETRTIQRLRRDIARANRCEAMCPVSTAIFLRILAESAWDDLHAGKAAHDVTPFWRVIEPGSAIAKKLRVTDTWLRSQRQAEHSDTSDEQARL